MLHGLYVAGYLDPGIYLIHLLGQISHHDGILSLLVWSTTATSSDALYCGHAGLISRQCPSQQHSTYTITLGTKITRDTNARDGTHRYVSLLLP
jgi:hypothetical protein